MAAPFIDGRKTKVPIILLDRNDHWGNSDIGETRSEL
jgi:glutaredoxin